MASIRQVLRGILVWSYDRGTLQYDIICALILIFIFFVPRSCFLPTKVEGPVHSMQKARVVPHTDASNDDHKRN
jgi:hypothetical protein